MHTTESASRSGNRIARFALNHKLISFFALAFLVWAGYFIVERSRKTDPITTYTTAIAQRGTIVSSVSGSGQVDISDQIDIKPKIAGDLTYIGVATGQEVKKGDLLFRLNAIDAQTDVQNAQTDLETAQLEMDELLAPVDKLTLLSAENSLISARESLEKLKRTQEADRKDALTALQRSNDDLQDSYEDAFNTVSDAFLDLNDDVTSLYNLLYDDDIASSETALSGWNNINALKNTIRSTDVDEQRELVRLSGKAETSYAAAKIAHNESFDAYKEASRNSDSDVIEALLADTLEAVRLLSDAVKDTTNMYDFWVEYRSRNSLIIYTRVTQNQSSLATLTGTANGNVSSLLLAQSAISSEQDTIADIHGQLADMDIDQPLEISSAERSIEEKEESLANLRDGADELTIRAKRIAIQQVAYRLQTAREAVADHYVYALFDGVIASVGVTRPEAVSSSTVLATLITKQQIAKITLNEIDISKVSVSQKATVTLDAIEDLAISGEVAAVDALSTVSQGVVTYDVTVAFDVQDERVRPGMSATAEIITSRKQDVLYVPNAAVKSQAGGSYVEILPQAEGTPVRQNVQIGASNDLVTEIASGLEAGDVVVTQTIAPAATSQPIQNNASIIPSGGGRFSTGGVRR